MSDPIFRYIVILLAVIVVIRILLSISANMKPDAINHPDQPMEPIGTEKIEQLDPPGEEVEDE